MSLIEEAKTFDALLETLQETVCSYSGSLRSLAEVVGLDVTRDFVSMDLRGIDFRGEDLRGFNFERADLSGADLRGTRVEPHQLRGATLTGALLDGSPHGQNPLSSRPVTTAQRSPVQPQAARLSEALAANNSANRFWDDRQGRAAELLADQASDGEIFQACMQAAHRRQFFVPSGRALARRGVTLYNVVDEVVHPRGKPSRTQWQSFCEGRPLSLIAILKIDTALSVIAQMSNSRLQDVTSVRGQPFVLTPGSVVPSIFYVPPAEVKRLRLGRNVSREKLSTEIFGPGHPNTLSMLEHGTLSGEYRITLATARRLADKLGEEVNRLASADPHLGPRAGQSTLAMPSSMGNIVAPADTIADRPDRSDSALA